MLFLALGGKARSEEAEQQRAWRVRWLIEREREREREHAPLCYSPSLRTAWLNGSFKDVWIAAFGTLPKNSQGTERRQIDVERWAGRVLKDC